MNIFFLALDPRECAMMHTDKHVVKMILESAQLLCTAHRMLDGECIIVLSKSGRKQKKWTLADTEMDALLYTATHVNHPSAQWARHSQENYMWLYTLFTALLDEYRHRYGKVHACSKLVVPLSQSPVNIDKGLSFEAPWLAMPDEYKVSGDAIASYRNYYIGAKTHLFKWKNRPVPEWALGKC
jgi:hypothetical protein